MTDDMEVDPQKIANEMQEDEFLSFAKKGKELVQKHQAGVLKVGDVIHIEDMELVLNEPVEKVVAGLLEEVPREKWPDLLNSLYFEVGFGDTFISLAEKGILRPPVPLFELKVVQTNTTTFVRLVEEAMKK